MDTPKGPDWVSEATRNAWELEWGQERGWTRGGSWLSFGAGEVFFLNSFSAVLGNTEAAQTRVNPSRNIQLVSGDQNSLSLILTTTAGV